MNINPLHWFSNREIEYTPKHFTLAKTPLTEESKLWILNTLIGRFSNSTIIFILFRFGILSGILNPNNSK